MKTILLPMVGYRIVPQDGITFKFLTYACYIDTINLNIYPHAMYPPTDTVGSGGVIK